jgi:hypothetical protein
MIEDITNYTRAISGKRGFNILERAARRFTACITSLNSPPTFAELLTRGLIAPGKPMILGYCQGQPQFRSLSDLNLWLLQAGREVGRPCPRPILLLRAFGAGRLSYVVEPHKNHERGLYTLIKPLEKTGHVKVINPFDTPALIQNLSNIRIAGLWEKNRVHRGFYL